MVPGEQGKPNQPPEKIPERVPEDMSNRLSRDLAAQCVCVDFKCVKRKPAALWPLTFAHVAHRVPALRLTAGKEDGKAFYAVKVVGCSAAETAAGSPTAGLARVPGLVSPAAAACLCSSPQHNPSLSQTVSQRQWCPTSSKALSAKQTACLTCPQAARPPKWQQVIQAVWSQPCVCLTSRFDHTLCLTSRFIHILALDVPCAWHPSLIAS